jgi:hypothetical protein
VSCKSPDYHGRISCIASYVRGRCASCLPVVHSNGDIEIVLLRDGCRYSQHVGGFHGRLPHMYVVDVLCVCVYCVMLCIYCFVCVAGALLPFRNATKIFQAIFHFEKNISCIKILINLRTYSTYNENIASFNVLHKPFIRIYQLF